MTKHRRRGGYTLRRRLLPCVVFVFAYLCLIGYDGNHAVEARDMTQAGSENMRVEFATSGGIAFFPGLARPVVIEANQLPEDEARKLGDLVAASRFFDRPAQMAHGMAPGAADYRQHTITIEQGGRSHTVVVNEPVEDPDMKQLVNFLEGQAKAARAKARSAPNSAPGKE